MTLSLVPFPVDQTTSIALAEEAVRARLAPGEELHELLPPIVASIRGGHATGGLLRSSGEAKGIVVWEPSGPYGVSVRLLLLRPPMADTSGYRDALELTERAAGPIAFAPGPLSGLTEAEESALLRERGYLPFGRSEMAFPVGTTTPELVLPPNALARPIGASDQSELARLHERAYQRHLDWFLSVEDLDPRRDADRQIHDYFAGRYGDVLMPGSTAITREGRILAAVIGVRRPSHVLLVDVMAEPSVHGQGFGRAALAATIAALRARGESSIVLNVTEENVRAARLYAKLGFVRTLGPSREWYDARRMPAQFPGAPPT